MKTACTLASPRTLTCANPPIGLVQPKISSIRLRMTWLRVAGMSGDATVYCRPSGLARLGDVTVDRDVWRHLAFTQRFDKLDHVVGFVGAERDPLLGRSMMVDEGEGCLALGCAGRLRHVASNGQAVAVLHQDMPQVA